MLKDMEVFLYKLLYAVIYLKVLDIYYLIVILYFNLIQYKILGFLLMEVLIKQYIIKFLKGFYMVVNS